MTVATCVCCSITSESHTRYASRVPCHGRSWRPWLRCQRATRAAKSGERLTPPSLPSVAYRAACLVGLAPGRRVARGLAGLDRGLHAHEVVVHLGLGVGAEEPRDRV